MRPRRRVEAAQRRRARDRGDRPRPRARGRRRPLPRGPLLPPQRRSASQVPPLRERREDIPLLVDHFLAQPPRALGKAGAARSPTTRSSGCVAYDWPGNVRELENVIERAVILADGDRITLAELPREPSRDRAARRAGAAPRGDLSMRRARRALRGRPDPARARRDAAATAPTPRSCSRSATARCSTRSRSTASETSRASSGPRGCPRHARRASGCFRSMARPADAVHRPIRRGVRPALYFRSSSRSPTAVGLGTPNRRAERLPRARSAPHLLRATPQATPSGGARSERSERRNELKLERPGSLEAPGAFVRTPLAGGVTG